MARFCLDRELLGTKDHLVVSDGTFWWAKDVPAETWHLDGHEDPNSDWCLDTVLRLANKQPVTTPPEPFVKEMSLLSGSLEGIPIPWQRVMPSQAHLSFVKRLVHDVEVAMEGAPLEYYRTVWVPGNQVIRSLERIKVNAPAWRDLIVAGEGNVPAIKSFEPDGDGFARQVVYDRFGTLTGRLTVAAGPQIQTLKREHRSQLLTSRYGDEGGVYALDFANLEARILLYEYNKVCNHIDLYGKLAEELGYDRKAVKGAVISELYGSSKWTLGKHLGIEGRELNDFVRKVQNHFNTQELLKRVKSQFVATGKVINRYGRPVVIDEPLDHIFISYYAQSTGADVVMLGFNQVIDKLQKNAPSVHPLALIHDSLLLDVPNHELKAVEAVKYVKVKGYVQKFFLKLEKIS